MKTTARNILIVLGFVGLSALAPAGEKDTQVKLTPVKWKSYLAEVGSHPKAKIIVVDAWATWCGPCMKNFPHLVQMHEKYAAKGLVAISLSLDDAENTKKVAKALEFLTEQHATFTNLILDERNDDAFEKLNVGAIPAVFLYTADGKELKRFTLDDVDKLFTYEQVEAYVKDYLDGKNSK